MEVVNINYTGTGYEYQKYSNKDENLIISNFINSYFGNANDYIEYFIYDEIGTLLDNNYNASNYYPTPSSNNSQNGTYSSIELDPRSDLESRGFSRGKTNIQYNFLRTLFNSNVVSKYWIKEISLSRTELKLSSQYLSDALIQDGFDKYQSYISNKNYYTDFYLNFGDNVLVICTNVAYIEDDNGSYLLIKLYEQLPVEYDLKSDLWIVDKIAESVSYDVDIQVESQAVSTNNSLRGANFKIPLDKRVGQTTPYYSYTSLFSSSLDSFTRKLNSYYDDKSISINVDFSDFSNFVHFSSITSRIQNFVYKLSLLENYQSQIVSQQAITGNGSYSQAAINSQIKIINSNIDSIITKFDIYEYYLYYSSESFAWPKSTSTTPYLLYSTTSSKALNWIGDANTIPSSLGVSMLYSASYYDSTNSDILTNVIPGYIRDDSSNQPYITFVNMIGQHFDNVWVYYKDVSNRFNATNNPNTGVSDDLVSDSLKSLGFPIYTNTSISDNLYYSLFGMNEDGSLLPPTGSELITNYVTSSLATLSSNDIQQEIYKRIYHNLPYLLKTKGTRKGIEALISCYGIPKEILTINEFGGYDRYTKSGISEVNNDKINIITSSLELSSSVLFQDGTLQYYSNNNRVNTTNLEVGFSPSDKINSNISSSLGYFNIDQLIGNPATQYSSSYKDLITLSNNYFAAYSQSHKVSEYIRLIKYYNNSVFKTIKDLVPARANVSTGLIIKSHILERNKYARHEPVAEFINYSQSIDMISIDAEPGNGITGSTGYSGIKKTILGLVEFTSSQGIEKYTGEFGGSVLVIDAVTGSFNQSDVSINSSGSFPLIQVDYGALYQNVVNSDRSKRFFDLDYTTNQTQPVNFNLITQSISNSQVDNYATYTNAVSPYAYLQDYNYYTNAFTIPRYYGSKNSSATYTTYTAGDTSYGKTAAVDKIKYQYAYLVDIYSSSFQFPKRANAQIKYIINDNQDVLDLTKTNTNIFTTQNIFKSGESTNVSLFKYQQSDPYIQKFVGTNNSNFSIYESGYRYSPILYNINNGIPLTYNLITAKQITSSVTLPSYTELDPFDTGYWNFGFTATLVPDPYYPALANNVIITANTRTGGGSSTSEVRVTVTLYNSQATVGQQYFTETFTIPSGVSAPQTHTCIINTTDYSSWDPAMPQPPYTINVNIDKQEIFNPSGGGSSTSVSYVKSVVDSSPCWWAIDQRNIKLSLIQSNIEYYNNFIFNGYTDAIDKPVFAFYLEQMDLIRLQNSSSEWPINSEYRVNSTSTYTDSTGSYILVNLDRDINLSDTSGSSTSFPAKICNYIVLKRILDETNVILNYDLGTTIFQDGILFPEYIDSKVKDNSGNTVKSLKQQNLITSDTNTLIFE
jgi:hypothetical protein